MSIHAPRSEIWSLFDRVILLPKGATLYSGLANSAAEHFEECGFELLAFVNPAEHLVDLAAVDNRTEEAEQVSDTRVSQLKEAWQRKSEDPKPDGRASPQVLYLDDNAKQKKVGFWRQLEVLTRRTTKVTIRDPMGVAGSLFEAISLSVITGWVFFQLGRDLTGIRSREGCLYTASSLQGYIIIMFETYRLTIDIQIFDRERSERVVGVPAFLLSRRLSRLFLEDLPVPIIFSVVFYFMAGLRPEVAAFFIFLALMIISQLITVTLSALCVAVSRDFAGASLLGNVAYTIQTFCCGYFVQSQQIPVYLRWMKWIVSIKIADTFETGFSDIQAGL
jgi:ABC-2 type transporter